MGELGSIFDAAPAAGSGDKGPDLRVEARVPAPMLARGDAIVITVPDRVPFEGGSVPRRAGPGDPPGEVRLHLGPQLADGSTLRLRGQGGEHPSSGVPGDLLVTLEVVEAAAGGARWRWAALAIVLAGLGAAWWAYRASLG